MVTAATRVVAGSAAGTVGSGLSMAATEQQVAQALHLWLAPGVLWALASCVAAGAASSAASSVATPSCPCDCAVAAVAALPWWLGPQNAIVAAAAPWADTASISHQINSVRIDKPMARL